MKIKVPCPHTGVDASTDWYCAKCDNTGAFVAQACCWVETKEEAYVFHYLSDEEWKTETGNEPWLNAYVYVRVTDELVFVAAPQCCVYCGQPWQSALDNEYACANCGAS